MRKIEGDQDVVKNLDDPGRKKFYSGLMVVGMKIWEKLSSLFRMKGVPKIELGKSHEKIVIDEKMKIVYKEKTSFHLKVGFFEPQEFGVDE